MLWLRLIINFTKFAHAVPIKSKQPQDVTTAFNEVLNKIGVLSSCIQIERDRSNQKKSLDY